MELQILDWIQTLRAPWLDQIMVVITRLGDKGVIWIAAAMILLLISKTRKAGAALALGLALEALCCNFILKPLAARIRPCDVNTTVTLLISRPTDFSFPSGHAAASFAAAAALYFGKNRLWIAMCVLALLVSFSRLYLYVHYPSDVLAGAAIGAAFGWCGNLIVDRIAGRMRPDVKKE